MYLAVLGQPLRRLYGMLGCGHGIYRSSLIISAYEIRAWPRPDGTPPYKRSAIGGQNGTRDAFGGGYTRKYAVNA